MVSGETAAENGSIARDISAVARIDAVGQILDVVCRITGMGFAAVARVTDVHWTACAVRDQIGFGLPIGAQLPLKSTLCDEIREHRQPSCSVRAAMEDMEIADA